MKTKGGQSTHQVIFVIACGQTFLGKHKIKPFVSRLVPNGSRRGMRGQKVLHEAEHTPLTFNFLAGNQEAEENKALKSAISGKRGAFVPRAHIPQQWSRE